MIVTCRAAENSNGGGEWHHVAAVLDADGDPSVDEIVLYVDGKIEQNPYYSGTQSIDTADSANVKIGIWGTRYFVGLIDEVRVYDIALSGSDIGEIYMAGGGVRGNGADLSG